ncbi:YolD-like family protein [Staphylococcus massiliensis]|uniref:YolD-like protein n=1 Tax=Staphylococcus massiliensis S46 TaxID=1229783 RepID=K9AW34_9STAP|nr:YolD-like family protein [Staphylococcus massiliensis]EKU50291.1 hypothetical protein C273_01575 [Staphylococcus massiliensis S46]MCG3399683.1 YolD-like family protein [Staphylococcus massiliensis]MCG3400788.1 YolD-like family protein [Staphylococcus massiliensis]MCG3412048.1 YolD-like family protein [Staphylococcus massiliensis]PNZ99040.1 YolD-like family protein [Staphylococcus massiliensis CCUG 55927]
MHTTFQNLPDAYKDETDYRNIPRQYLNPRIPKGRGMVKWAPFATIPEQFDAIQNHIDDQSKITKPLLSEDQLAELNHMLCFKLFHEPRCKIKYFSEGEVNQLEGSLSKVYHHENLIIVKVNNQTQKLRITDILEII